MKYLKTKDGRIGLSEQESMAPGINEKHPESLVIITKTTLNQQESQIASQETAIIAPQLITQTHPSLSRSYPSLTPRPYVMDVRLGKQTPTTKDQLIIPHRSEKSRPSRPQIVQARLPIISHQQQVRGLCLTL